MGKVKKYVKKQFRRAKTWAKNRYTGPQGAVNIAKDFKMIRTLLNTEKKYHDVCPAGRTATNFGNGNYITAFGGIAPGSGHITRTGDTIKAIWTQLRWNCELVAATANGYGASVRYLVILDRDPPLNSQPVYSNIRDKILRDTIANTPTLWEGCSVQSPYSIQNIDQVGDRFKVLKDFRVVLSNVGVTERMGKVFIDWRKLFPKKQGLEIRYPSDGATNFPTNYAVYVISVGDNPDQNTTMVSHVQTRTCYVDN